MAVRVPPGRPNGCPGPARDKDSGANGHRGRNQFPQAVRAVGDQGLCLGVDVGFSVIQLGSQGIKAAWRTS